MVTQHIHSEESMSFVVQNDWFPDNCTVVSSCRMTTHCNGRMVVDEFVIKVCLRQKKTKGKLLMCLALAAYFT